MLALLRSRITHLLEGKDLATSERTTRRKPEADVQVGIVLKRLWFRSLYAGSDYNTDPFFNEPPPIWEQKFRKLGCTAQGSGSLGAPMEGRPHTLGNRSVEVDSFHTAPRRPLQATLGEWFKGAVWETNHCGMGFD